MHSNMKASNHSPLERKGYMNSLKINTKGVIRIRILKKNRFTRHMQWPKEKVQKGKQTERSTKYTHKTKDRVTRTPIQTGGEFRCS